MRWASQLRMKHWSRKSRRKIAGWNRMTRTEGKPGIRNWRYDSFAGPTCSIKDICATCGIPIWMGPTTTLGQSMRHTTSFEDMWRKLLPPPLRVMGCRLRRMGNGGTCLTFGVTVVNRWGTTQIPQSVRTIRQVRTKTAVQVLGTTMEAHKEGAG